MAYNSNSSGYGYGGGAFGTQVGQIQMPSAYGDLSSVMPGLSGLNSSASSVLNSELSGTLSPGTQQAIKDASATMAAYNGMPGTSNTLGTLGGNKTARDIGTTSQQLQSQGLSDYSKIIPTVSQTQTVNPALQTEVNLQNAVSAASPDPAAANSYAQNLFQQYINQMNGSSKKTQAESMGLKNDATYRKLAGTNNWVEY